MEKKYVQNERNEGNSRRKVKKMEKISTLSEELDDEQQNVDGWNIFVRCLQQHMLQRDEQPLLPSHSNEQEKLQHESEWKNFKLQSERQAYKKVFYCREQHWSFNQEGDVNEHVNASTLHHRMRLLRFLLIPSLVSQLLELVEFCCWELSFSVRLRKTEKTHFPTLTNLICVLLFTSKCARPPPAPARHSWIFVDDLLIHSRANGYMEYKHSELSTTACGGGRQVSFIYTLV